MASFERAIPIILEHEGGYADNPADPGGATKYGVSLRYLQSELAGDSDHDGRLDGDLDGDGDVDADDIRALTVDRAITIYRSRWWDRYGYGRIDDDNAATKIFDVAVNMGAKRAHLLAQRAAYSCGQIQLVDDGILGPLSVEAINTCWPTVFLHRLCTLQAQFYRNLAIRKPQMEVFLNGWLQRARWPFQGAV